MFYESCFSTNTNRMLPTVEGARDAAPDDIIADYAVPGTLYTLLSPHHFETET